LRSGKWLVIIMTMFINLGKTFGWEEKSLREIPNAAR
jgi:hypothetical protein